MSTKNFTRNFDSLVHTTLIPASPAPKAAEGRLRRAASEASWGAALCFKFRSISGAAVYRGCATVFGARGAILMLSGAILMLCFFEHCEHIEAAQQFLEQGGRF